MKRIFLGFLVAVLGIVSVVGIAAAGNGASPSPQEAPQEAETAAEQGWMGVHIADITQRIHDHYNLTVDSGVVVINVAVDSPADQAGVEAGDVILAINGDAVESAEQVTDAIRALAPGTAVVLTILRSEEELTLGVTLAERPPKAAHQGFGRDGFQMPSYLPGLLGQGLRGLLGQGLSGNLGQGLSGNLGQGLSGNLGQGLSGNLLHSEHQVLGPGGETITVEVTYGMVQSVTDTALTVVRKDDQAVEFQTTGDTKVIVGGHPINLSGLKVDSPVLVMEKDGSVILVLGWPRDLMGNHGLRGHRNGHGKPGFVQPRQHRVTPFDSDQLQTRLRQSLPDTQLFDRITGSLEQARERSFRLDGPQFGSGRVPTQIREPTRDSSFLDRINEALEQARDRTDGLAVPQSDPGQGQTL